MNVLLRFPPPALEKLLDFKAAIGTLAKTLMKDKMDAVELGIEPEKDLISVLGIYLFLPNCTRPYLTRSSSWLQLPISEQNDLGGN
jgi:hypothetical protein